MTPRGQSIACNPRVDAGSRFTPTHGSASYLGAGLCDKNGVPIREGDTVNMLGEQRRIRRVQWHSLDGPITRLEIGIGWWLTPFTAEMCEVIGTPNGRDQR